MHILKDSTLRLYGPVGVITDDNGFDSASIREALDAHGPGDLNISINSPGGLAFEGSAIYNMLKDHPGRIVVTVEALAASAASLIVMAGDEIRMHRGAMLMVHDPRTATFGTSGDHRKSADFLDKLSAQYCEIYATRTGKSKNEVRAIMDAETWLDGSEAVEAGFATRKIEAACAPIASFDLTSFRNTPHHLLENISMTTEITEKSWAHAFLRSAGSSKLPIAKLNEIIDASASLEVARAALIDTLAVEHNANLPSPIGTRGGDQTFDNPTFLSKAIGDAIYARMSGTAPEGAAAEMAGRSLLDLGAIMLQSTGTRVSWRSKEAVASAIFASHSTSDFPNLLTSSAKRVLMDSYQAAESPFKLLAKRRTVSDFRMNTLMRLSEAPSLNLKPEGAEITHGSRSEAKESYRIDTYARIFSITREALINDDLTAFSDSSRAWGKSAAEREATVIAALFTANSGNGVNLDDNNPIYTTARKNKAASGTVIDVTNLGVARQAMREFVGLDGKSPINSVAKHIVVGPAKETQAEQALAQIAAAQVSDVNPFSGKLTLHVEPRLPGNAWRLFADPALLPVLEIAYLNGAEGPQVSSREGWNTLGMEFRAVLDFGCGIVDWRGTYLNAGA